MTDESRALATRPLTQDLWRMIQDVAPTFYKSRIFGVNNVEQAIAIMLKGYELGLPLAASFEFISVVEGKPTLSPRGALALVLQSGLLEEMRVDEQTDRCTVFMKRRNGPSYQMTWTIEDAKRAGVVKPRSAWDSYPSNMLRWRAVGFVIDVLFSDVCGGLKRADEFGAAISPDGQIVNAEWSEASTDSDTSSNPQSNPEPTPETSDPFAGITLDQLVEAFGAEAVIVANEGRVPASDAEVADVARRLANG